MLIVRRSVLSKRSFAEVSFPISVSKSGNNSFTATAHNGCKSLFLSSVKKKNMKGCSLFNAKYYLCNRNSERSLVIQNNELSRISLISKSLPIQPVFNRRVLCFKHLAQYHIFITGIFHRMKKIKGKCHITSIKTTSMSMNSKEPSIKTLTRPITPLRLNG